MAVKGPWSPGIRVNRYRETFGWFDDHGMLARAIYPPTVFQVHPHAVQVKGMIHHRIVHKGQANALAIAEADWLRRIGILLASNDHI